ncbi:hypothetical protein CCR75_004160 [Bremia lactucae]|uniref:GRIP domain-containing protein n=1 Tax=Bremia lactucae TaxID=4779 RepID=A0A976IE91_BRELC|nr:hypothetical protein CCR75_004160 [Bremia lactucae]
MARLHAVEAEMTACKSENLRMIFELAKTADGASRLKHDHEDLHKAHSKKASKLDKLTSQVKLLACANETLESKLQIASDELRYNLEAFLMQKEDYESIIYNLNCAFVKSQHENDKLIRNLEEIKSENDVLEERISELLAGNCKTEAVEGQEKDREVQDLRTSLVQAKVNNLEQKQQLTALEKKLVEVSMPTGPACTSNSASLDAERREFEAALIEMIEMEKKLQVAYEAKQGLESTLQERMEAKTDLEGRLSIAEDKIVDLERQLEQKIALTATIEEQLRLGEEERENLADKFAKTRSKLERSRGKLEEKAIEFETFKATTSMLKDERSRLFNEIALLKDTIAKSEAQKAEMAESQELANEELEDQLNELADKIAEIEAEKQDLRARLKESAYRSEEDIHQLRERLCMLMEEKLAIDEENYKLGTTIELLQSKIDLLMKKKAELEGASIGSAERASQLEEQVADAKDEIITLKAELNRFNEIQQSLEESVSSLQEEKGKLELEFNKTKSQLREELGLSVENAKSLQAQMVQSIAEKDEVMALLSDLQEHFKVNKSAFEKTASELEVQKGINSTVETKNTVLKQMAERALHSLQSSQDELFNAKSNAAMLTEERDTLQINLQKKQLAYVELATHREKLTQQVKTLTSELESMQECYLKKAGASEESFRALKDNETTLRESLASVKRDLAEAEACVLVLVEERDAALKNMAASDLKIEILTSQQSELYLAAQKLESESNMLRSKSSADAVAAAEVIHALKQTSLHSEETLCNLKASFEQTQASLQAIQKQLVVSQSRVAALEQERDATRSSLNENESTCETLNALQDDLQQHINALRTELKELRDSSTADLGAANETIASLQSAKAEDEKKLASLREELAEAEGCVMLLVEERDATKKLLSKKELTLEVLSSEYGELQLKCQSVNTELEALRSKSAKDTKTFETTICGLQEELTRATESLNFNLIKLSNAESRISFLTAENDTMTKTLIDLKAAHELLQSTSGQLIERIKCLEVKIESLCKQHLIELESTHKRYFALQKLEAETKQALDVACRDKLEIESNVLSLTAALNEKESIVDNLTISEKMLHAGIHSLESKLEKQQKHYEGEAKTAEETIRSLNASASQMQETLELMRQKLADTETKLVAAEEDRESASKALSEIESHRDAQNTEVSSLHERIQSLESELEEQQKQFEQEAETAEEAIQGLNASASQMQETLESMRQKLADTEAKLVAAEKEHNVLKLDVEKEKSGVYALTNERAVLVEKIDNYESNKLAFEIDLQAATMKAVNAIEVIEKLENQICTLEAQLHDCVKLQSETSATEIAALTDQIGLMFESSRSALAEVALLRNELAVKEKSHSVNVMKKDEVILTLKSKLEEVMAAYKRLKKHLHEMQDRLTQQTTTLDRSKASYDELNIRLSASISEMDSTKHELALSREHVNSLANELRDAQSQIESFEKQVLVYDDQINQTRCRHDEVKEALQAAIVREEATQLKMSELENLFSALSKAYETKEQEVQSQIDFARRMEEKLSQVESGREEINRKYEAERMELEAQLSNANKKVTQLQAVTDANADLHQGNITQLRNEITKLKQQAEVETKGATAARTALGTYKKRAHTALKKASSENKLNIKQAAEYSNKLELEVSVGKRRISALNEELQDTHERMEAKSMEAARTQSANETLMAEKCAIETALRLEIDSLKAEVTRLETALDNERRPLETQIQILTKRNESLEYENHRLEEEAHASIEQAVQAKEDKISDLSKQLQAAVSAVASLANEAVHRSYSPASSPIEKERRSTASSSRSFDFEGGNGYLHHSTIEAQHEHMTAAVVDSCPIPRASKAGAGNDSEQLARKLSMDEDEIDRLKAQLQELELSARLYQDKYESTFAKLEAANRQQQVIGDRSSEAINIEYLKNVIMKYIQSQVSSEKEQLVPVIATLLNFSPQEYQMVATAHRLNEEGSGIFGTVFSLFGGVTTAPSAPKSLAAPHNFKPSPTTRGNTIGAALGITDKKGVLSFGSDEDEFSTPLNPFAA